MLGAGFSRDHDESPFISFSFSVSPESAGYGIRRIFVINRTEPTETGETPKEGEEDGGG